MKLVPITIDEIRRLRGWEKTQALKTYRAWNERQKKTDKNILRNYMAKKYPDDIEGRIVFWRSLFYSNRYGLSHYIWKYIRDDDPVFQAHQKIVKYSNTPKYFQYLKSPKRK